MNIKKKFGLLSTALVTIMGVFVMVVNFAYAANTTEVVTGNTAAGENQPGWLFNRDVSTSTPYKFSNAQHSIGSGSLYVLPIGATPANKFIAENFLNTPIDQVNSFAYDYLIAGNGDSADSQQFYLNVYANIDNSTNYYDCRFDYVASGGSTSSFTTHLVNVNDIPTAVTKRGSRLDTACPATLAGMPAGSYVRAIAINVGDTNANDQGLAGYLDKVVVNLDSGITTYDFEALTVPVIQTPANNSSVETGDLDKIDWTNSVGQNTPITYLYEAYSDANYTSLLYQSGPLSASEIATPGTPPGVYYVRVRAQDADGNMSAWSNGSANPYKITVVPDTTVTPSPSVSPSVTSGPYAVPAECSGIANLNSSNPIVGTNGDEKIKGTSGNDLIFARGGMDKVDGSAGNDCIVAGNGNDNVKGGSGNDVILGGSGDDDIDGGSGNDMVYGEGGTDKLKGGSGNDSLDGGGASDSADGGSGSDACSAEVEKKCEL